MSDELIRGLYFKKKQLRRTGNKQIWQAKNVYTSEICIIKLQPTTTKIRTLLHEGKFLQAAQGYRGIPFMQWCGKDQKSEEYSLIVQKLGPSLKELLPICGGTFSLKTTCMIGLELLAVVKGYHMKGFLHRNINPSAIQIGIGAFVNQFYFNDLIDSKSYLKKNSFIHVEKSQGNKVRNISMFISANQLSGTETSRKDDLEAIILMLIYLIKGQLPWSKLTQETILECRDLPVDHDKYLKRLNHLKTLIENTDISDICKGVDPEFSEMLKEAKRIDFKEEPCYYFYTNRLKKIMYKNDYEIDELYDWCLNTDFLDSKKLKIKKQWKKGLSVELTHEAEILKTCYQPYQEHVEIDPLAHRFR